MIPSETPDRDEELGALRATVASLTRQRDYYQAECLRLVDEARELTRRLRAIGRAA